MIEVVEPSWTVLNGQAGGTHIVGDYALIAAMRGWTPMIFMTRVRL